MLCLRRLGLPTKPGTDNELRERIKVELSRLKASTGRSTPSANNAGYNDSRCEIGSLPRVVVLKSEVDRILALPIAGYWDLPQCHAVLTARQGPQRVVCPAEDAIYSAFASNQVELVKRLLSQRTRCVFEVLTRARGLCEALSGRSVSILVNQARMLHSEFMDVCRQDYLRKLFFMQQVSRHVPNPLMLSEIVDSLKLLRR